jgi:anti-sigma regulatory factor (Ser/Thr protein kinase)
VSALTVSPPLPGFHHAAVFYRGLEDLVQRVVPFVAEGLANDEPVLVAELPDRVGALTAALGDDAARVEFLDMAEVGRNPARIIPAWLEFVAAHPGRDVRGVGEPAWAGRTAAELDECQLHEALLNVAFDDVAGTDFRLLCPYDADALPDDVLAGAMRTHPYVGPLTRAVEYGGHRHAEARFGSPLTAVPTDAVEVPFTEEELPGLRGVVRRLGEGARLRDDVIDDLVLAVHELATNSIRHAGGAGVLLGWQDARAVVLEVSDVGVIEDPLVGREPADPWSESGRGLWMANRLCDLVQVRSSESGTRVRLYSWL